MAAPSFPASRCARSSGTSAGSSGPIITSFSTRPEERRAGSMLPGDYRHQMKSGKPPLLAIVGPTGIGKTALAVILSREVPMEVISADSRQVYRGMDIGTGKPTPEEQAAVRHHLIDVVDPVECYDAARFRRDALAAIEGIRRRGRLPVVVGGTGLYVRALVRGIASAPPADPAFRAEM